MENIKMNIHEALAKKKLLDKRIKKEINNSTFCSIRKKGKDVVFEGEKYSDFNSNAKANLQRINDLISLKNRISKEIILSNATTEVTIDGNTMTVAEAIDLKNQMPIYKLFLDCLKDDFRSASENLLDENSDIKDKVAEMSKVLIGSEKNNTKDSEKLIKAFEEDNFYELVDPINIKEEIRKLEDFINGFEANVDFALSTSNAITSIEVIG